LYLATDRLGIEYAVGSQPDRHNGCGIVEDRIDTDVSQSASNVAVLVNSIELSRPADDVLDHVVRRVEIRFGSSNAE